MMAKIVLVVYLQFSFESHFVPTNCCYFVPVQKNYSRQPVTLSFITVNFCATPMRIPSTITMYRECVRNLILRVHTAAIAAAAAGARA